MQKPYDCPLSLCLGDNILKIGLIPPAVMKLVGKFKSIIFLILFNFNIFIICFDFHILYLCIMLLGGGGGGE